MKFEIANKYAQSEIFRRPVSKQPFTAEKLSSLLTEAAAQMFPPIKCQTSYSRMLTQIRLFQRFIEISKKENLVPDESLLEEFRTSLQNGSSRDGKVPYRTFTINSAIDGIRSCLNKYFYPKRVIDRPILIRKVYLKYHRFFNLTEISQKLIIAFEKDGRCIDSKKKFFENAQGGEFCRIEIERKQERLSEYNRKAYIDKVFAILGTLGKSGIEELTKEDFQKLLQIYRQKNKEETAHSYLAALYSIIANGIALKILKINPFSDFPLQRRKNKPRQDFLMPDQIDRLLDLESLDWNNSSAVRERCVTALIYDMGLRASTIAQLDAQDVKELPDARYQITVRGIFLKGGNKEDKTLYVLFQQTIPLLRYWMDVTRPKLNPKANRLFVSQQGKALTRSGIRNIVRDCCKSLDIRTVKGKIPSPHTLRHTLATLNIEPFGKSLSSRLMQQRLIHMDLETLIKNYVHNNPLAEMAEYKKLLEKGSGNRLLEKISREDFFDILDSLSSARGGSVLDIKGAYERERKRLVDAQNKKDERSEMIKESMAVKRLSSFGIDYRSLRAWGLKEGFCRIDKENGRNRYLYEASFIEDLSGNYIEKEEAFGKFAGSRASFYRRIKVCRIIKIGQRFFIFKDDFLRFLIEDRSASKRGIRSSRMGEPSTPFLHVRRFESSF